MFRKKVTPEQRAFVDRVSSTTAQMRKMLVDAATDYVALDPPGRDLDDETREQAWEWVERIAVQWRDAEQAGATHEAVEDELSSHRPHQLLGAIEDSLILAVAGDPEHHPLMLSTEEALDRIAELDQDGAWDKVDIRPRDPSPPSGETAALVSRFDELESNVLEAVGGVAAAIFESVASDDEPDLSKAQVAGSREHLVSLAACGRELDHERELVAALVERRDLLPTIGVLRSMVQALVLRLSEDPERRAQAIPLQELAGRFAPILKDWKTWTWV